MFIALIEFFPLVRRHKKTYNSINNSKKIELTDTFAE
jgi:hypothetical protein